MQVDTLLFDSQAAGVKELAIASGFILQIPIEPAGHRWTLRFTQTSGPTFAAEYNIVWLVPFGGMIISLLLFGLTLSLRIIHLSARQIEQSTSELI
jgi:hypothetical protein